MAQSAPLTARARSSVTTSPSPSAFARLRTPTEWSARTMRRAALRRRAARGIGEPIAPTPTIVSPWKIGSASGAPSRSTTFAPHEFCQRRDYAPVGLLAADRKPQRIRQPIGRDRPKDEAPGAQERVSIRCGPAGFFREGQEQEIPDARRHLDPELCDRLGEPRQPARIVRDSAFDMGDVLQAGDACGLRCAIQIEWPADAVQR